MMMDPSSAAVAMFRSVFSFGNNVAVQQQSLRRRLEDSSLSTQTQQLYKTRSSGCSSFAFPDDCYVVGQETKVTEVSWMKGKEMGEAYRYSAVVAADWGDGSNNTEILKEDLMAGIQYSVTLFHAYETVGVFPLQVNEWTAVNKTTRVNITVLEDDEACDNYREAKLRKILGADTTSPSLRRDKAFLVLCIAVLGTATMFLLHLAGQRRRKWRKTTTDQTWNAAIL